MLINKLKITYKVIQIISIYCLAAEVEEEQEEAAM